MKTINEKNGQVIKQIEKTDLFLFYLYIVFGVATFAMIVVMGYFVYSIFM
jgi:hypothetical protein